MNDVERSPGGSSALALDDDDMRAQLAIDGTRAETACDGARGSGGSLIKP